MAACILTAQIVMVPMAILVGHRADVRGRKLIFLAGFAVPPIRGILYTLTQDPYALVSIQILDGVGAGPVLRKGLCFTSNPDGPCLGAMRRSLQVVHDPA